MFSKLSQLGCDLCFLSFSLLCIVQGSQLQPRKLTPTRYETEPEVVVWQRMRDVLLVSTRVGGLKCGVVVNFDKSGDR